MSEIRIQKIDWVEFVTLTDYLRLKEEKQELEYLWDINEEFKEENKKLKYVIDSVMEKAGIEYIRLADWDVFTNPKNKLQISDTIQVDILNHKQ